VILSIQASQKPNDIAILDEENNFEVLFHKEIENTEEIYIVLKNLINSKKITIEEINFITVGIGPGSFTGTRSALSFAKAFCLFKDIILIGVDSFSAVEFDHPKSTVLINALNERVYYKIDKEMGVDKIDNLLERLKNKILCGTGVIENIEKLKDYNICSKNLNDNFVTAINTAKAGYFLYKNNTGLFDKEYIYSLKPLYISPPNITKPKNK